MNTQAKEKMPITSKGRWLVDCATLKLLHFEDTVQKDGQVLTLLGGTAPLHNHSKGRVYAKEIGGRKLELHPEEINAAWRDAP